MVAKEYLSQIRRLNMMINQSLVELEELRGMAINIVAPTDKENVKSSGDKDRLSSAVAKIVDMENSIDSLIDDYLARKQVIVDQINGIEDDRYYNILQSRYIHSWSMEKIAVSMDYSLRATKRLHKEALEEFDRLYHEEYKNVTRNVTDSH